MSSGQGDLGGLPHGDARSFFNAVASFYDRVYAIDGVPHRERMRALLRVLGPASEALVLGVGTGRELPTLLDAGFTTTGIDCSEEMLAMCARRARHGVLVRGDFWQQLPFNDATFGAAVALHGTMAHPPSMHAFEALALELTRVIRPGGVFVLELPTLAWFTRWVGQPDEGPGVLLVEGECAAFVDRRSGAAIRGLVVSPEHWVQSLARGFECTMHLVSDDEARVVARRTESP